MCHIFVLLHLNKVAKCCISDIFWKQKNISKTTTLHTMKWLILGHRGVYLQNSVNFSLGLGCFLPNRQLGFSQMWLRCYLFMFFTINLIKQKYHFKNIVVWTSRTFFGQNLHFWQIFNICFPFFFAKSL